MPGGIRIPASTRPTTVRVDQEKDVGGVWFTVEGLVANGERAVVRRAQVRGTQERIAIKILPNEVDEKGTVLPREVLAMRMCQHPCVLSVKKVFYDSYSTFICSTLYTGGNVLDRTLDTGGFAEEDAVIVVQDVLDALDHIHSRGLIHAAVEPSNIFLVSGDPISADYNHAVLGGLQRVKTDMLRNEETPGDVNYVSPELIDDFARATGIGPEVDLWSVGATLYCMLSGSIPFSPRNGEALSADIKRGEVKFVAPFWDMTSRLAKDFILQLMAKKRSERLTSKQCRKHAWMEAALEINRRTTPAVLRYELTLRKLLLFKDVDDDVLRELATHFHLVKFSAGKFVAKRGNTCNSMYFVYSGSVVAYVDGVEVDEIKPGGFFGEAAFLGVGGSREHVCDFVSNGHRWPMGRHCLSGRNETELFKIERRDLDIIVDRFPNVKERLWAVGTAVKVRMQRALQIGDLGNGAGGDWSNDPELPGGDGAEGDTRQRRGETEVREAGQEELCVVGDGEASEAMSSPRKPAPPPRKSIAELEAERPLGQRSALDGVLTGKGASKACAVM